MTGRPGRASKGRARAVAGCLALAVAVVPAVSQAQGVPIVRDAETEALIRDYMMPIWKIAGVTPPKIWIVPDQSFNAFVTGRGNLFVNVGTIIQCETPNELIGVLAHETGHMANDDIARLTEQIDETKTAMLLASILGVGVAAAGAATGSDALGQAGSAVLSGAGGVATRGLLHFQREQESAADRNAIKYLTATGQSGAGMLATMKRLADQNLLLSQSVNPFLQSHPLPRERVAELEALIAKSPYTNATDPPALRVRHDLVRAKLVGFTWPADRVIRRYPMSDNSLAARYARAIVAYRSGKPGPAQAAIDGLIKSDPGNPFFEELKGQALLETGHPDQAVAPLRKAVSLAPKATLIKMVLGQALVANPDPGNASEAIKLLAPALVGDAAPSEGYRALARAYAVTGDEAMAQLATAQGLFADGNYDEARIQATRAQAKLKKGSPAWLRADDIVSYKPSKIR